MSNPTFKKLLLTGTAVANLLLPAYGAQAGQVTVYVAANFAGTLQALENRYNGTHSFVTFSSAVGATGTLKNAILANTGITIGGIHYPQADLFFAADVVTPQTIASSSTWAAPYTPTTTGTNYVWEYAIGQLELWTNNPGTDVSGGLPFPPANFVIANPATAPYGLAALQVLQAQYGYTTVTVGGPFVSPLFTSTNIGSTFDDVNNYNTPGWSTPFIYGFVALSQIAVYNPETFAMTYTAISGTSSYLDLIPGPLSAGGDGYDPIVQAAVKINGPGSSSDRDAFVAWLQTRDAQAIMLQGGYTFPGPIFPK